MVRGRVAPCGEAIERGVIADRGIVVFSRMDSARLPGKALQPIAGRALLGRVIDRARRSQQGGAIVVATSDRDVDGEIASFAAAEGVRVFRGATNDVAGRALACAEEYGFARLVRISGDSPFFDPALIDVLMAMADHDDLDLATNVFPRSFPVGSSVEVVSRDALRRVVAESDDPADREHVTRYLYQHADSFRIRNLAAPDDRFAGISLGVDAPGDIEKAAWMVGRLDGPAALANLDELARLARAWDAGGAIPEKSDG